MPDHYNNMPVPPNIMEEATKIGQEQDIARDEVMMEINPSGSFSQNFMNILIKSTNKILSDLFKEEPVVEVEGDLQEFPMDLTTKLSMISKAAGDARIDFKIDFNNIKDDKDIQLLAGELEVLLKDKDFIRYLEDTTLMDETTEDMPADMPEDMPEEMPEEMPEDDLDDLFASRM